jgi:enterochelin esterase-like enzyme
MYKNALYPLISLLFICLANNLNAQSVAKLEEGDSIVEKLISGEQDTYQIDLENGMGLQANLVQVNTDLLLEIYAPTGELVSSINRERSIGGVEQIDFTAAQNGTYQLVIRSVRNSSDACTYSLSIDTLLNFEKNIYRVMEQELPSKIMFALWKAAQDNSFAIDSFMQAHNQRHVIEPIDGDNENMLVTYFCVPDKNTEYVMLSGGPDFLGLRFQRLPSTDLFFVSQRVPVDARFTYGFNYFLLKKAGPNREIEIRTVDHAYDGMLEMPEAPVQSYLTTRPEVDKGNLSVQVLESDYLLQERKFSVYLPANYKPSEAHDLLIVLDGETYGGVPGRSARIPLPAIIDNLLSEQRIKPVITVMVWSMGSRSKDFVSDSFADFIGLELLPWLQSNYNLSKDSSHNTLAGFSRGGFAAASIALRHSSSFANVLSQSGSYWIKGTADENHWIYPESDGKLIGAYINSPKLPIRFYMDVGLYDAGASMLGMNRQFRDILKVKGYDVIYQEFKGGHSYVNWRGTISDGLIALIGTEK